MIVIDASVLVKVLTGEFGGEAALESVSVERDRIAPDWVQLEVASAIAKKVNTGELRRVGAEAALRKLSEVVTEVVPSLELIDRAFELSLVLKHAIYDCLYLALAERLQCILVTADAKFVRAVAASPHRHSIRLLA